MCYLCDVQVFSVAVCTRVYKLLQGNLLMLIAVQMHWWAKMSMWKQH